MADGNLGLLFVYHVGSEGQSVVSVSIVKKTDVEEKIDEELQTFAVRIGMSGVKTEGFLGPVVYASATTFGMESHFWAAWVSGRSPTTFSCDGFSQDSYRDFSDDYLELTGLAFY